MTCDIGRLQAFLDEALSSGQRVAVEQHLASCRACEETLAALRQQEQRVAAHLDRLEPSADEVPDIEQALVQFRTRVQLAAPTVNGTSPHSDSKDRTTPWSKMKERIAMTRATLGRRWRPAAIGAVALMLLIALFSFAPAREAAAQFLDVFRVRKFAVIPVDPAQIEQLEDLGEQIDAGLLGEPTVLREAGEPQHVETAEEADALAGFDVRTPATLPNSMTLREFSVVSGPAMRLEVSRDTLQMLAAAAGVDNIQLPEAESVTIEADFPMMVQQQYRSSRESIELVQMPSPSVTIPEGIDPAAYGEVLLRLLGTPADDAQRLAASIDWTSTLVIPFPTDVGSFREVSVNGTTAVLLEQQRTGRNQRHKVLLWEQDDIVYALEGSNVDASELVRIAESLQ